MQVSHSALACAASGIINPVKQRLTLWRKNCLWILCYLFGAQIATPSWGTCFKCD